MLPILSFNIGADPLFDKEFEMNKEVVGLVKGIGNYFEITKSPFLNIILESVEIIDVSIEMFPSIIDISIQKGTIPSTDLKITGFDKGNEYYHYEDSDLVCTFFADDDNAYCFTQDLTSFHHVEFKDNPSTVYIHSDGTIDPISAPITVSGNVYEMTDDIHDEIIIEKSGIIFDGKGHTVYGPPIEVFNYGIYINDGSNWINDITIKNVIVDGFYSSIRTFQAYDIRIIDNEVYNCVTGIRLQNSDNCIVKNNYVDILAYGVDIRYGSGNHIIQDNILDGNGYYFSWGPYVNLITAGVLNTFCPDNNFIKNQISNVYRGVWIYTSYDTIFSGNNFQNCRIGLWMNDNHYSKILHNYFYDIEYDVIDCWGSNDIIISGNIIDYSIFGFAYGINFDNNNNILVTNNIIKSIYVGVWCYYNVYDVIFYHNSFIDNYVSIISYYPSDMATWIWDNGAGEGNYWSDYLGVDDGSDGRTAGDGIGDTLIAHPQSTYWQYWGYYNLDNYPLMSPYPILNIEIDIKPGSDPNSINIKSKGNVPVAIITTDTFHASAVDPSTISFLDASPIRWALEDVDYDGDLDMILHFKTKELDFNLVEVISEDEKYAELNAETIYSITLTSKDSVKLIGFETIMVFIYSIFEGLTSYFPMLQRLIN
jgi:parallel beta-helix repeat protein